MHTCITCKKTRNYIFFSLPHDKRRKNWIRKNELKNKTKYNRIFILLLQGIRHLKTPENKGEKHTQNQFKKKELDHYFAPDKIIQCSERKMKVVHEKDDKNKAIVLG